MSIHKIEIEARLYNQTDVIDMEWDRIGRIQVWIEPKADAILIWPVKSQLKIISLRQRFVSLAL